MKLSMSVDRRSFEASTPPYLRGRLEARICVSGDGFGKDISLLANADNQFEVGDIAAMLRLFANHLTT